MIQEPKITVKKQAKTLSHSKATASRSEGNEVPKLGPPPSATSPAVSKSMKANRPKNTKPEKSLRQALWQAGCSGYRLHWTNAPGRPDISYPGRRIAIFVNGCFWHRCPVCNRPSPKNNADFWERKFIRNRERDERKKRLLEEENWDVLVIWECEIKKNLSACVDRVRTLIEAKYK